MISRDEFELEKDIMDWLFQSGLPLEVAIGITSYMKDFDSSLADACRFYTLSKKTSPEPGKNMPGSKIMLFYGQNCYPSGGWDDFKGYFPDIESAKKFLQDNEPDACFMWAHIVFEDKIVLYGNRKWDHRNEWLWREEE